MRYVQENGQKHVIYQPLLLNQDCYAPILNTVWDLS